MVDLPLADRPVIQTVTPFWFSSFCRWSRVTEPSCQVMLVAFCSAMEFVSSCWLLVASKKFSRVTGLATDNRKLANLASLFLEQRRAEIAFAATAHDGDDHFALVFGAGGDFHGRCDVAAGTDAAENALFLCQAAGVV